MDAILYRVRTALLKRFEDNFRSQAFFGKRWKKRKSPASGESKKHESKRALLVRTGALRRALGADVRNGALYFHVRGAEYGVFHNEGTDKLPQRQFVGWHDSLLPEIETLAKEEVEKALGDF